MQCIPVWRGVLRRLLVRSSPTVELPGTIDISSFINDQLVYRQLRRNFCVGDSRMKQISENQLFNLIFWS